jgi:hypothetical protein
MDWLERIISLYLQICDDYQNNLWVYCQRFSNYTKLSFTDEEVITIYMYGIIEGLTTKKQIYNHAKNYWHDLFPNLPQYEGFVYRVNKMGDVFTALLETYQNMIAEAKFGDNKFRLIDSMPIIMAQQGRRFNAKVAPEIADKGGYCATKKLHYYGVKLHIVGCAQESTIPLPEKIGLTSAGTHDLKAYEQILPDILHYDKFADKAYCSANIIGSKTYTPVKKEKDQEYLGAADSLYSTAIARIRQPIESLNNWIEEKVKIQMASKVRSYNGFIVHVFGKLAVAFNLLVAKFSF